MPLALVLTDHRFADHNNDLGVITLSGLVQKYYDVLSSSSSSSSRKKRSEDEDDWEEQRNRAIKNVSMIINTCT